MNADAPFYATYDRQFARRSRQEPDLESALANPQRFANPQPWWPESKEARILEVGCGWGEELLNLWAGGYHDLVGIDISAPQVEVARRCTPPEVKIVLGDARQFLKDHEEAFDLVLCLDVIEHFNVEEAVELARAMRGALRPEGACVVRTVNMASVLAGFSRYIDITHKMGHTEFSLFQLLDAAGFAGHRTVPARPPRILRSWRPWRPWRGLGIRRRLYRFLNKRLHDFLFRLRGQRGQSCYDMNITVQSFRRDDAQTSNSA